MSVVINNIKSETKDLKEIVKDNSIPKKIESPTIDTEELNIAEVNDLESNLINDDGNKIINCDPQGIVEKFGGQADDSGVYPRAEGDCDNYARGYCLYAQTGEVADFSDVGNGGCGLERYTIEADNRKEQAQAVFDRLMNEGKPSVIHVNSVTGNGHWMCVIGIKDGVTREDVTIGDLIVIDSAGNWGEENSAKIMPCSDNEFYCQEGLDNCFYDPGYQVIYYE